MIIVQERKNRATGTTIQVVDNRDGSFDSDDHGWITVCDDHGNYCSHPTRKLALWHASMPEWCGTCQAWMFPEEEDTVRYVGVNKNGVAVTGSTGKPAARVVEEYFEAGFKELTATMGDRVVGKIEVIDGQRTWWVEGGDN